MKYINMLLLFLAILPGCTWQETAKFTAHAVAYTAMTATGNQGDFNMVADFTGQAAEGLMDLAIDSANGTCSD